MRRLLAATLLLVPAACGAGDGPPRLLIVGWDGASFRMVDRLLAEGRLPNLERLLERGSSAALDSTIVPISSSAWTGMVTGKGPGATGVYGFFEPIEGTYDVRLISARSNRATPLWRILTHHGKRSLVFGVPNTYPPEPILGTLVAGMLSPFRATYAWPPELTDELRQRDFEPDLDVWREARGVSWQHFWRQLDIKEAILVDLLEEQPWELAMVVFKSLDVASHLAYEVDFYEHVGPVYARLDAALGALLDVVGSETNVLLVSDHGFHEYEEGLNLHAWLVEEGYSVPKEVVRRFRIDDHEPLERRERQGILQIRNELDWSRTTAFAATCEGNFGSIRLNLAGREPEGSVSAEEIDALLTRLASDLRAATDADGNPLVRQVFRSATLYPGPHRAAVPDLLFEVAENCQVFTDAEERQVFGPYGSPVPDHERPGILIAAGPDLARRGERGHASVLDVAPTALHLLGLPVYAEMEGRVLDALFEEAPVPHVVSEADDPVLRGAAGGVGTPFTPEELRELEERVRRLGYGE